MATLVSFHAHPDDESIQTGGTLAKAARRRPPVVLVFATRGEHGEVAEASSTRARRSASAARRSATRSAEILGRAARRVPRLRRLRDGGHAGERPRRLLLARRRRRSRRGGWRTCSRRSRPTSSRSTTRTASTGTPTTSRCTASACGRPSWPARRCVFEATMNRDHLRRIIAHRAARSGELADDEVPDVGEELDLRPPEARSSPRARRPGPGRD